MVVSAPTAAGAARTRSNDRNEREHLMLQQHLLLTPYHIGQVLPGERSAAATHLNSGGPLYTSPIGVNVKGLAARTTQNYAARSGVAEMRADGSVLPGTVCAAPDTGEPTTIMGE
jgi:hypothetical protein